MRVVLQHPPRQVAGDRLDYVVGFTGLEQTGHNRVPQVVESQAWQSCNAAEIETVVEVGDDLTSQFGFARIPACR
ncbi:MAG: hypothetical protein ABI051_12285 [Vicinamibacterales bacterium]